MADIGRSAWTYQQLGASKLGNPEQVICVDPSAQVAGATSDLQIHLPCMLHRCILVADAARGGVRTQGITLKAPKRYQAAIWHTGLQRRWNGPVELQCRSHADRIPAMESTSVASNTHLVAPVVTNNPLTTTPSHGRYLLPAVYKLRRSKD
jgi:hypothetical protein